MATLGGFLSREKIEGTGEAVNCLQTKSEYTPTQAVSLTRVVMYWKALEYVGLAAFIVLVPRLMGPERYGRFAAVVSLLVLLITASGLGGMTAFGRFVPQYLAAGDWSKARALFVQLFWARAGVSILLAAGLFLFFPVLLPGISGGTQLAAASALVAGATASSCYQVFYGLNDLGKWSCQDALFRFVLIALLFLLGGIQNLNRAINTLLFAQVAFLLLGLAWTRRFFNGDRSALGFSFLWSHLSFGMQFFMANLMLMAIWRGGEVLILTLSSNGAGAAYFNVANSAILAPALLVLQFSVMFVPSLTSLLVSGEEQKLISFLGYVLKYATIGSFGVAIVVYALGDWAVRQLLGAAFLPVVDNLRILALGLPAVAVLGTAGCQAIVYKRPLRWLAVTLVALLSFLTAGFFLIPLRGALGASMGITLALALAAVVAHLQLSLGPVFAAARFWRLALGGLAAVTIMIQPMGAAPVMGLLALLLFLTILFWTNVVSLHEVRQIAHGLTT